MRWTPVSIGILRVSVLLASALWAGTVSANTSTSYMLISDFPNAATNNGGNSTSFTLAEGQQTWNQKPLASTNFQIVLPGGAASSSSSSSSSSSAASGGATSAPSGSRGGRPGPSEGTTLAPSTPTSSAGQAQSSAASAEHEAATAEEPTPSTTIEEEASRETAASIDTEHQSMLSAAEEKARMLLENFVKIISYGKNGKQTLQFFGAKDTTSSPISVTSEVQEQVLQTLIGMFWIFTGIGFICIGLCAQISKRQMREGIIKIITAITAYLSYLLGGLLIAIILTSTVHAAETTPSTHIYNGRLLDSSGNPVTTSTSIRFSYWKSADFVSSDITGAGAIDTSATNYSGWQETHTVTPNTSGYFSVTLGSSTTLPDFSTLPAQTLLSLYLQIDVKAAAAANTAYELLDSDSTDTAIDRSGVLSVPFAKNADMVDQREIGTGSGNIAILRTNGQFAVSTIPNGTNTSSFTLDSDNSEISEIALTFGAALGKKLTYDIVNSTFKFNASVEVQGNLTVTGLINGVNITQLQSSTGALKAFSGGGLNLNVSNGSYRLGGVVTNYNGGTIALPASLTRAVFFGSGGLTYSADFPNDESFIPIATVTTSAGSIVSVLDRRTLSSDDREHSTTTTFNPAFEKASYQGDGADNVGQLSVSYDNTNLNNFYVWTTTKSTLQDYDVILRVPVPEHFVRWRSDASHNPIALSYRSTSASSSNNKLDIQVYDTNGVPVTLSGSVSSLANTSWTTSEIDFTGTPTWTAGQNMLVKLHLSAKDAYQMQIGTLKLQFIELE